MNGASPANVRLARVVFIAVKLRPLMLLWGGGSGLLGRRV
jgi:hypothetical protein